MGRYDMLLEERAEEKELRRGRPPGTLYGSDSSVLDRRLADALEDRPPGYASDLAVMSRLITLGIHSLGAGM